RPSTCTASPTAAAGADEVKTNTPSEVASLASGVGSWIQKPFVERAVTIPFVATIWPLYGEMSAAPWLSGIWSSGPSTVSAIAVTLERFCASSTAHGKTCDPGAAVTVARNEKVPSPAAASPWVPSSNRLCVPEPPSEERSQNTWTPVLGGAVPGVTLT